MKTVLAWLVCAGVCCAGEDLNWTFAKTKDDPCPEKLRQRMKEAEDKLASIISTLDIQKDFKIPPEGVKSVMTEQACDRKVDQAVRSALSNNIYFPTLPIYYPPVLYWQPVQYYPVYPIQPVIFFR